jgi:hypothetical protein
MKTAFDLHHTVRQSRERLTLEYGALKEELNFSKRLRHSIQEKPWPWLAGAALVGLSVAFLKARPRSKKEASKVSSPDQRSFISEKKVVSSPMGTIGATALSLLQNSTVRTGLFSTARFVIPLAQEAITGYLARKKEKETVQEWNR